MVDDRVRARLKLLREEFELGQKQLAEVESQRVQLTETMLRISGAIQVLEELAGHEEVAGQRPVPENSGTQGSKDVATLS